jgi:DnaK suppressor protein
MRKREQEKFKKLLLLERQSIMEHLAKLEDDSENEVEHTGGDSVDLAASEITQTALAKLGSREEKLLKKIDHALAKFEDGEFGDCERCGEKINPARLEARLVAQYCIDCKTELEQDERRYSDDDGSDKSTTLEDVDA